MTAYKQVILVRQDLNLPKGKLAAQVAHAALEAAAKSEKQLIHKWKDSGAKKVVVKVASEKELFVFKQQAEDAGLKAALIIDAGHTTIPAGTKTCLGIGPDEEEKIDKLTGDLPLL